MLAIHENEQIVLPKIDDEMSKTALFWAFLQLPLNQIWLKPDEASNMSGHICVLATRLQEDEPTSCTLLKTSFISESAQNHLAYYTYQVSMRAS